MKTRVLVTVSGGNVQGVEVDGDNVEVYVRDWDNIRGGDPKEAYEYLTADRTSEQMDFLITAEGADAE